MLWHYVSEIFPIMFPYRFPLMWTRKPLIFHSDMISRMALTLHVWLVVKLGHGACSDITSTKHRSFIFDHS